MRLSFDQAADIVDIYGPDPIFWPDQERPIMESLIQTDEDFANYVDDAKWLEDMLSNWKMGEDGAEIDWDDDDTPRSGDGSDVEDDDNMVRQGGKGAGGNEQDEGDEEDEDEAPLILELDPDQLQDMDGMLQDFIAKEVQKTANDDEFRVFTRDYDELKEIEVPDHVSIEPIDQAVARATGPLQKDLRRLIAARSQAKRLPGMRRGKLHGPNLHRIMSGDDRVFYRREEAPSLDTAITLLMDCSGSMNGTRLKLATETSYAIASVLSRLGVAFECLGFTDNGKDPRVKTPTYRKEVAAAHEIASISRHVPLSMPKFKTFEERWVQSIQRRFAHVYNSDGVGHRCGVEMNMTPEGCGIEFAARRLLQRKEKRKIMLVMTDGQPGGTSFGGYNPYVDLDHSKRMVKAVEAAGVDLVGIGIQHVGPTAYYSHSMIVQDLSDMPKQLLTLLKKFIVGN